MQFLIWKPTAGSVEDAAVHGSLPRVAGCLICQKNLLGTSVIRLGKRLLISTPFLRKVFCIRWATALTAAGWCVYGHTSCDLCCCSPPSRAFQEKLLEKDVQPSLPLGTHLQAHLVPFLLTGPSGCLKATASHKWRLALGLLGASFSR